ncbi:MAG: oligosaccharide flippase family protein [Patescibacteria group bacterium]
MKTALIFVLYKTSEREVERLKREVKDLGLKDYLMYFIDNSINNRGYAGGANEGIKKALKDGADILIVANTDISLGGLKGKNIFEAAAHFDVYGLAMRQEGKIYYGGEIEKWRMSGGLIDKKPGERFAAVGFPSGSLFFFKRVVVEKIGLWDEGYFLYYEEVDFAERARRAGFKVGIDSGLVYEHFEISKESPTKNYWLFRSRLRFLWKYGSVKQKTREILRFPKTIYEEVAKRPFYLNFFSLNFASIINKILHFILFLVLIRMFKPQEYAVYTLAWTHIGLLSPILDFGTTSYGLINLPGEKQKHMSQLFSFRAVLSLVTFALTIGLAFVFHYPIEVLTAIVLTSVAIFSNMISGTFLIFASIINKSYLTSVVSTIFQVISVAALIATIFISRSLMNIFIAIFILYLGYGLVNFFLVQKQMGKIIFEIDLPAWLKIAKKSVVYLVISLMAGFYSKADVIILNYLRGAKEVGIYSAGYRFLDAMMFMLVAYNVSAIPMFSSLVKENKTQLFLSKIKKDVLLVGTIGLFTALGFFFFSPVVLPVLMKGDYGSSIQVLRIIIFALPLLLLTSVFLGGLYALGRTNQIILLFFGQVVYNVIANFLIIPRYGYVGSAWITVIGEFINTAITFTILYKAINEDFTGRSRPLR